MLHHNVGTAVFRRKARTSMTWLRSKLKNGSRIALFALAIQFALSFGHFHGVVAQAAPVGVSNFAQPQQPASDRDSDQHPNDICSICAVIAMANAVLFASPPVLPLPHAVEFSPFTAEAGFAPIYSVRVAFQPRAPPIS
jgi:hypothetical protein